MKHTLRWAHALQYRRETADTVSFRFKGAPFHSNFICRVSADRIEIVDLNAGGKSVTNDIEEVIRTLDQADVRLNDAPLVYQDSTGSWDGVAIDALSNVRGDRYVFCCFAPLRETTGIAAAESMRSWIAGALPRTYGLEGLMETA